MRKTVTLILLVLVLIIFTSNCFAYTEELYKLRRGPINIVTSFLEMPKQIKIFWDKGVEKGSPNPAWVVCGVVKGIANTVGRIGSGVWDIFTFNVAVPANFEPLMKPDFVYEKLDPANYKKSE